MYLDSFVFPDEDWEWNARLAEKRTCYNTMYPMGVLSGIGLERLDLLPLPSFMAATAPARPRP